MAASSLCLIGCLALWILTGAALAEDLVVAKLDRRVDLTSQVARTLVSFKIENSGSDPATKFLFALSKDQFDHLAYISAASVSVKGKSRTQSAPLTVKEVEKKEDPSSDAVYFEISLEKSLEQGQAATIDVQYALTHTLTPFPREIRQSETQLVLYHDSAYVLSPYLVKFQTTFFKLPGSRVESYTKVEPTKLGDKEIKYGPYENVSPLSQAPVTLQFENNRPFAVVETLEQEIEISHWGNVYATENYHLKHTGARLKGGFSRLDYQAKGNGVSAFRYLAAILPPRAHSIYYRDEIGNISTSHVRNEPKRTIVEFEPRYPLFGGWQVKFTLGYSVPLQDFVFLAPDGSRYLNFTFGSPLVDVVVEKITTKVVLPEGSRDPSVEAPLALDEQHQEVKHSYLDTVGRKVVVLTKKNVVAEHNVPFQVKYKFNPLAMLAEPLMLIFGFFCFFLACMAYLHFDFPISKSSAAYQARLQQEEVLDLLQRFQKLMKRRLFEAEKLEAALRDLARTGDVAPCKASKKLVDATLSKEVKAIHEALQATSRSSSVNSKVEALITKEKEKHERLLQKLNLTVDLYERKMSSKEIDSRLAPHEQKYTHLKSEVAELMDSLDD
ncbi:hypothetical protein SELMODRAFT_186434 [Selaginella moellendorffii]|uniref:Dolichyl-diphosphooligosaccharide--protein glycosyltransferase subunit 1 n=1 Tax=Selaginella moellendorffii TaxID=88036 RepID=D8T8K0_SELML|nr:dolichyl-diphosphooligosaccharide--protein glycosyltransferase subunit 1B [Selaginella moellendorffii]EFJ07051.1 hypothetical protein SELMODRAFT_186434 [Selaginella moellendorffii]|eukprot:XP_002991940.1 dolichyl-diphosphooligosaccharide--protein glycosyltransferase subunit 1B [Selaginella moellendorffii]